MGHGQDIINNYVAEIPFMIWLYKENQKDINKMKQIERSLDNKYITEDIPYTLLDLSYI